MTATAACFWRCMAARSPLLWNGCVEISVWTSRLLRTLVKSSRSAGRTSRNQFTTRFRKEFELECTVISEEGGEILAWKNDGVALVGTWCEARTNASEPSTAHRGTVARVVYLAHRRTDLAVSACLWRLTRRNQRGQLRPGLMCLGTHLSYQQL